MIHRVHKCQHKRACVEAHGNTHGNHKRNWLPVSGELISDTSNSHGKHLSDAGKHHDKNRHGAKQDSSERSIYAKPLVGRIDQRVDHNSCYRQIKMRFFRKDGY